jgi:hypothetical protein
METSTRKVFGLPSGVFYGMLVVFSLLFVTSISGNIYSFAIKEKPIITSDPKDGEVQKPQKEIEFRDSNLESLKSLLAKDQADGVTAILALTHMQDLDRAHIKSLEPNFQKSEQTKRLFKVLEDAILNHEIELSTILDANVDLSAFTLLSDSGLNEFLKIIDPSITTNLQSQVKQLSEKNAEINLNNTALNSEKVKLG